MDANEKPPKRFNVAAMEETLEELNEIKSELHEVISGMKEREKSGKNAYIFSDSRIVFKKEYVVGVRFDDVSPKELDNFSKDVGIKEDDVVKFIEEGNDDLDEPRDIKGIVVESRRLWCVIEFNIRGDMEEKVLAGKGILRKDFNVKSIETQILMIKNLIDGIKLKRVPLGVIPYVFRISNLPIVDLGSSKQWMTVTFKNKAPDPSQEKAIKEALQGPAITILKGPPGTGKTSVIAEIALQLLSNGKTVLITSQTNSALDNILSRIVDSLENVNLLRIASTPQIIGIEKLRKFCSEELITKLRMDSTEYSYNYDSLQKLEEKLYKSSLLRSLDKGKLSKALLKKCKESFGDLDFSDQKVIFKLKNTQRINLGLTLEEKRRIEKNNKDLEEKFVKEVVISKLSSPVIVAATCVGLYSNRMSKTMIEQLDKKFISIGTVILDEASKASRSESLIPLAFSNKAIVVGDERQLPPYLEWTVKTKNKDPESLFDNLIRLSWLDSGKTLLNSNYRSHEDISNFISEIFYKNSLYSKRSSSFNLTKQEEEDLSDLFGAHLIFIDHEFNESLEVGASNEFIRGAYQNRKEVDIIINILKRIEDIGIKKEKVALISPYRSQVRLIRNNISGVLLNPIGYEVDTVDSFQGREKPLVIVSLTRSNDKGQIGFVKDLKRLNVMFSRAEDFLIVIGNSNLFMNLNKNEDHFDPFLRENFSSTFKRIMQEFRNKGKIISYFDTIFPSGTE